MATELMDQQTMLEVMKAKLAADPVGPYTTVEIWNTGIIEVGDELHIIRGFVFRRKLTDEPKAIEAFTGVPWAEAETAEQEIQRLRLCIERLRKELDERNVSRAI